jgi:hypothetical protein
LTAASATWYGVRPFSSRMVRSAPFPSKYSQHYPPSCLLLHNEEPFHGHYCHDGWWRLFLFPGSGRERQLCLHNRPPHEVEWLHFGQQHLDLLQSIYEEIGEVHKHRYLCQLIAPEIFSARSCLVWGIDGRRRSNVVPRLRPGNSAHGNFSLEFLYFNVLKWLARFPTRKRRHKWGRKKRQRLLNWSRNQKRIRPPNDAELPGAILQRQASVSSWLQLGAMTAANTKGQIAVNFYSSFLYELLSF